MKEKEPPVPKERAETTRQALLEALRSGRSTARALAITLGLREKDVLAHLEHVARSLAGQGGALGVSPATCLGCGYVFEDRRAFGRPSRCPRCKGERIEAPKFFVEP
ncbi:transcriptional regulator [Polyangium sp. 15x6]|uniref:transcriptional regulator n=1 Tax=Polyangium sp. 15x6 TaxID=3042687 RepID=UPI00249B4609|nr:transcriptional regulator [Polyangium sp. 15x6]MDI3287702.1 transcriptional regulator [Polyangium sp. 15x6]